MPRNATSRAPSAACLPITSANAATHASPTALHPHSGGKYPPSFDASTRIAVKATSAAGTCASAARPRMPASAPSRSTADDAAVTVVSSRLVAAEPVRSRPEPEPQSDQPGSSAQHQQEVEPREREPTRAATGLLAQHVPTAATLIPRAVLLVGRSDLRGRCLVVRAGSRCGRRRAGAKHQHARRSREQHLELLSVHVQRYLLDCRPPRGTVSHRPDRRQPTM